jgi:ribosomal protein S18 acetylase RimI-like enzyme
MIIYRNATAQDMEQVHGLIMELAVYERQPEAVIISPSDLVQHGFIDGKFECFVAENSETQKIVGMALFYSRYSTWKGPTLHLEDLYIQPEHRGRGIGDELFRRVANVAAQRNVGRMEWTVLEWNEPAIHFYTKHKANLDAEWHLGTLTKEQLQKFI